jgi:hypothetical protein
MTRKLATSGLATWLAFASFSAAADTLLLTAPPRDVGGGDEQAVYGPVAEYLSSITGKKIVYKHPGDWLSYQSDMRKGAYDVIFDGPHFVSWRLTQLGHHPVAKLPGKLVFVIAARKDNAQVDSTKYLEGRMVCGMPAPNLATLTMYSVFDNPARQPLVVQTASFKEAFDKMMAGKCVAAAMGKGFYNKFDKDGAKTKVLYTSPGVPNQAFSVSGKFTPEERRKIAEALTSDQARAKMAKFFEVFSKGKNLLPATTEEFDGISALLKDVYGFDLPASATPSKSSAPGASKTARR